jgi:hypothetical protein
LTNISIINCTTPAGPYCLFHGWLLCNAAGPFQPLHTLLIFSEKITVQDEALCNQAAQKDRECGGLQTPKNF